MIRTSTSDQREPFADAVSRRTFLGGLGLAGVLPRAATAQEDSRDHGLQVGFGTADITPSVGMGMPGGFFKATGKGVRDRLHAVACAVRNGNTTALLVGTDSLFLARASVEQARRAIEQATRIPGEHILMGASHTHTGGPVGVAHGSEEEPRYLDRLVRGITDAATSAWRTLQAAELGVGTGHEASISFNRRFLMRDGREITHPGKPGTPHHLEIVRPAGPIDPAVGVLAARVVKGHILGVVVNFACHNTVMGGNLFSADYVGQIRKHLQAYYGDKIHVVFLLGACGDITQVDNLSTAREFGPEYADMMGQKLAAETIRTIDRMHWLHVAPVAVTTEMAQLSIRPEIDPDRERPAFGLGSGQSIEAVYARGRQRVAELRRKTPRVSTEVQAIRIGPLGIVTNGSEYFCDYGLRMKACSPLPTTWMVTLANDVLGYVPTPQAFVGGGYETRTTYWSRFSVDAGQRLLEAGLKALRKVASPS